MSNEELAMEIKDGDTSKYLQLWEQVNGWAAKTALRWYYAFNGRRGIEFCDLMQCAFLALINAVTTFNPSAGGFIGWYDFALKTAFCEAYGARTQRDNRDPLNTAKSLDAPIYTDADGNETLLSDVVPDSGFTAFNDIEDQSWNDALHAALADALEQINQQNADVIRREYFGNESRKAIADDYGVTYQMIRQREQHGLREIRRNKKAIQRLQEFSPYSGVGFGAWKRTGCSIEEYWLLFQEKYRSRMHDTDPSA